ncbi:SoxR reducing system RseC family protein [Wenzhouxiangella marina]|uniref:Uncharacterized protein n=1 Tax=Wenzhouxiangella marina TaxID=1579979 RepID=A0A0K0XXN5_9GAMM|nr:SoxR reducing system RseC family protein [Wenzhouxiangella marina]AKS42443.1 hypothetical protein WM2015_2078 [Wenzhouxiangella marina]MBB6085782.1 sigma-E factor negative regulatory protein RseC [Wenzhouxiangella marina]
MSRFWQPATVIAIRPGRIRLRFDALSQCERCLRGEGCGAGVFSRLFARQSSELELPDTGSWAVGQRLRVGVEAGAVLRGSLALYGLPLAGFLIGAMLGQSIDGNGLSADLATLGGGLMLALVFALAARRLQRRQWNPLLEPLSASSSCGES